MSAAHQEFEELEKQFNELKTQAVQINTKIEAAEENFENLKKQAQKEFNVSTLEELEALLQKRETENNAKLEEFRRQVQALRDDVNDRKMKILEIQNASRGQ